MLSFEYTIDINDQGRPVIQPSEKTDKELDLIEHKFMALEITRTILDSSVRQHEEKPILPEEEYIKLKNVVVELNKISDIFALTIRDQKNLLETLWERFDIEVDSIEEMLNLNYHGIVYEGNVYSRVEGLKVKVKELKKIYELRGGIDNNHWIDVRK